MKELHVQKREMVTPQTVPAQKQEEAAGQNESHMGVSKLVFLRLLLPHLPNRPRPVMFGWECHLGWPRVGKEEGLSERTPQDPSLEEMGLGGPLSQRTLAAKSPPTLGFWGQGGVIN